MGRVFLITSGKGGVGKTTASAHLARALGEQGRPVALIDADCGLRNLDAVMGLENRVVYDLLDVAWENCTLAQALIADPQCPNVHLLAAPRVQTNREITPEQMAGMAQALAQTHDFVLMDCPAGIDQGFDNAASAADHALLVVTCDVTSVRDAKRAGDILAQRHIPAALVINRYERRLARRGSAMTPQDVAEIMELPVWAIIPGDDHVVRSGNLGSPLPRRSRARTVYAQAAARMANS